MGPHTPDGRDSPRVVAVEVTVPTRADSPRRASKRGRVLLALCAIGAVGILVAFAAVWSGGGGARHGDAVTIPGANGVAAAYGYPLGCMSVTILAADRTYARADLSHTIGCGQETGYAPAIFHYAAGRWRLVPDAIGYMCNPHAMPAVVAQGLDLCVGSVVPPGCARIGIPGQGRPAAPLGWPCAKLPSITGVV
jgi:hypothetical protein